MASRGDGDQSPFATFADDSFCFPFKSTFDLLHFGPFPSAPPPSAQHLEMVWPSFSQFVHIIFLALFGFELVGNGDLDFSLLWMTIALSCCCCSVVSCSTIESTVSWSNNGPDLFRMIVHSVLHL